MVKPTESKTGAIRNYLSLKIEALFCEVFCEIPLVWTLTSATKIGIMSLSVSPDDSKTCCQFPITLANYQFSATSLLIYQGISKQFIIMTFDSVGDDEILVKIRRSFTEQIARSIKTENDDLFFHGLRRSQMDPMN
jgi:hypothetical protein